MANDIDLNIVGMLHSETDADDVFYAQIDGHGNPDPAAEDAPRLAPFQLYHPLGFAAIPFDANKKGQCQALQISLGYDDALIALDDPRAMNRLPPLKKGESLMYGYWGNFVRCKSDGSVAIFTTTKGTVEDPTGKSVWLSVKTDSFERVAPWGRERFDASGWHIRHAGGSRIDMGAIQFPGPLGALPIGTYLSMQADMVSLVASSVALGPQALPGALPGMPGSREPLAKADTLLVVLAAINAAATSMQALLDGLINTPAAPGSTPLVSNAAVLGPLYIAAKASVSALTTASSSATTALASVTTSTLCPAYHYRNQTSQRYQTAFRLISPIYRSCRLT